MEHRQFKYTLGFHACSTLLARMSLKVTILVASALILIGQSRGEGAKAFRDEDLELERQLKLLNKPPVKSIQTQDGSTVDCIDINKQLAFDHPLLQNHTIQMEPSSLPKGMKPASDLPIEPVKFETVQCPHGTVPVRRTRKKDLIAAKTLSTSYGAPSNEGGYHFSTVKTFRDRPTNFYGARSFIEIWKPNVSADQFSSSEMWIRNADSDRLNSIQLGIFVIPSLYSDDKPRLTSSWTADGHQKTGCFNLLCPGFVQITRQYYMALCGFSMEDPASGNWWFIVRNSEGVVNFGYWPGSLFNNLADHATELEFGGQVYSPPNQPSPQMGSGHFYPKNAFKTASVSNIAFVDGSNVLTEPENISMVLTPNKPNCYYANYCEFWDDVFRYNTMFGGPGGPNCIEY
ncbi:uncharacterized protein LOC117930645 [Vitis riparia]|uniref:uncharacterized protein LOC117930645 n=1 Tax=Vitis riparia TaxID=96939 RepID=UPI00155AB66D|nr:uncharacterized protein LOC117930645 [Vitis riparia]